MRAYPFELALEPSPDVPLFVQITRALIEDIRRGRLRPGAALPGSRALARSLGVHRNTVVAAYRELASQGWVETRSATMTYVSTTMPDVPRRRASATTLGTIAARAGFDLPARVSAASFTHEVPPGAIVFSGGMPDLRLLPTEVLARAYRRVLRNSARRVFEYGDARGDERLRAALADMLAAVRGLGASAEDVLVTRGSQMALDLSARALLRPGDVVAVEALGYHPAWEALAQTGARLVPLPVDAEGLSVDALAALVARESVRAVYVTPHHQYPSTALLSPARRIRLLDLARAHRIAILEDDYDHEFHYDGRPVLPLASADRAGVVIYIGTLSKILAPGLRIGFVVAPAPLVERLAAIRTFVDRQGDLALERAVAELLEDGEVQRHARRMRRIYQARRDVLTDALRKHLGDAVELAPPPGGMAMWVRVAPGIDVDTWAARALDRGVVIHPARRYAFDGRSRPFFRAGFAALDEREIHEGVARLRAALPTKGAARAAS
ncbi:PLP-dependent aminotransferase family protein [Polyangium sp. 15x6]|uniref:MocR-like pyridoxine biosynthesis transcription factor PdxR n=1 Tax=Polyangium sp. 15x6 TaxID=3042687 RepID=UPI00249BF26F|nr:PLP-dependent aminotransferase family protein [Polyangium sp. 15x6]MDI3284023.1 PLP-dependent aminotransferase family protein [Polyangium sp. 15x6]